MSRLSSPSRCSRLVLAQHSRAQEKRADTLLTVDKYLDFEQVGEPRVSPDGSQIIYTRRWVNKLEDRSSRALDHERRRLEESLPRHRRRARSGRRTERASRTSPKASRRARRSSCGGWTPKARRRRSRRSADAPVRPPLVARRQVDRLQRCRAEAVTVEDRHAGSAEGREVDRHAAHRAVAPLPPGSPRLHRSRAIGICSSFPPTAARRGR